MTEPDWLRRRGGTFRPGPDRRSWYVILGGKPRYRLVAVPVQGKFGCAVTETINGRRAAGDTVAESEESALQDGLENLAKSLGWLPEYQHNQ